MKKKFLLFIVMLILFVSPVLAEQVYETDYAKASENVDYKEKNDGSIFLAGNVVNYSGTADGIIFAAANSTNVAGVSEYALLAGNTLDFTTNVKKDALTKLNFI